MGKYYEVELDEQVEVTEPKKFKVLLLNDDHSTMEFVLEILTNVFRKDISSAEQIMLNVHNKGKEVCGVYTHEIAATKIAQVREMAKKEGFPLKAIMEEE
ncbi:MAG: ATP-dependent Clp protease adaptor ClpS [Campylobacteraceae bacterium]|jgi:ATP-dependent Clp protease adaptor protein ClpS|nr:ATP-dependent Clp protease adaptor ClpS [Campylobacteraceae bacterium]